jgi:hypothetical protein
VKNYIRCLNSKRQIQFALSALTISIAIAPTVASSSDRQPTFTLNPKSVPVEIAKKDSAANPKGKLPTADGVYLYSQSSQSNQLGQEYMVFEMRRGKVTGAFYLPQSEFSCFQGSLSANKLSVTVAADANSEADSAQAAVVGTLTEDDYAQVSSPYAVGLQNYYQLSDISDNDRRILNTCQSNYQQ